MILLYYNLEVNYRLIKDFFVTSMDVVFGNKSGF